MKKILIVVDMQNDFIDAALGTKEAIAIVPNVKKKIEEYKARGDEIIFTRDTHYENYLETNEGKHLPVKHCIKDTFGWQITEELDTDGCVCIDKETFGFNHWKELGEDIESIELVGLCTDICVVSNALLVKANFPNVHLVCDSSCCAGVTPEKHEAALEVMRSCHIEVR